MAEKFTIASSDSSCGVSSLTSALSNTRLDLLESENSATRNGSNVSRAAPTLQAQRRRPFRRSNSYGVESIDSPSEVQVLVINTGGTIGMVYRDNVLAPQANALVKALRKMPGLHDEDYAQHTKLYEFCDSPENTLVLPQCRSNKRIVYSVIEYSPLLDSCNMSTDDWAKIAIDVETNYQQYSGFVILHGTDTMAYTASALSFMCENQGKPIILTGSQVPIYEMRNDGHDNLLGALLIAGQYVIPEVSLYFQHHLYRGNRVTKIDAGSFTAFSSPNLRPLVKAEVEIKVNWDTVWRPNTTKKFMVHTNMNRNVGLIRLFPGITVATVRAFLQPPMEGIVLETYGTGNAPDNRPDILEEFKKAVDRGVLMINCTQCLRGSVSQSYATGKALTDVGLIPGCDMTPEAALAKLSYVLGKAELTIQEKRKMLSDNLRGEMTATVGDAKISLRDSRFIQAIARSLSVSCKEELEAIRDALTPSLACAAAKAGDIGALEAILDMGGNLCSEDYDGRTPLHVATCEGHLEVVKYLLSRGATVYAKDRYGDTPLKNAVRFRHSEVIKLLRQTGAHFSSNETVDVGTDLCSLAANGDVDGLKAWHLAGLDLNQCNYDGQRLLEFALTDGNEEVITFLKSALEANQTGYVPKANALVKILKKMPGLHDEDYAQKTKLYEKYLSKNTLVLPEIPELKKRIVYIIIEYSPLLDSSCMTRNEWAKIATDIKKNYKKYEGFVILHGTDTMAYTASALSFMCENLGKPVILTGSQIPIFEARSDAPDNLLGALLIAGQYPIPEVSLYFHDELYRGNRVSKCNAEGFAAFSSFNLCPLVKTDIEIQVNWNIIRKLKTMKEFVVQTEMNQNVGVLKLYPGITAATVQAFLQPPMEGIVLETYGMGNAPGDNKDLLMEIKKATDRGVLIINCTQCLTGSVSDKYATGKVLAKAGVIPGFDMTSEAALAKLSYVLAKAELSKEEKKKELVGFGDASTALEASLAATAGDIGALEAIHRIVKKEK